MNQTYHPGGAVPSATRSVPPSPPAPITPKFERLISAEAAAELLDLHHVTLLRWAREGRVPHHRLGGRRVVFRVSELEAWLNSGQPSQDGSRAA